MKSDQTMRESFADEPISTQAASKFMRALLQDDRRPIDDVIDRLSQPDGASWFAGIVRGGPIGRDGFDMQQLCVGGIPNESIDRIRKQAKKMLNEKDGGDDARLIAIATYFLCVAAAIVQDDRIPADREPHQLHESLSDFANSVWSPASEMLSAAADLVSKRIQAGGNKIHSRRPDAR